MSVPHVIDLADVKAWETEVLDDCRARRVSLGDMNFGTLRLDASHVIDFDRWTAWKARQIGIMLIIGAEALDPSGLEIVHKPDAPGTLPTFALDSLEGGSRGTPTDDAGEPAGAVESPVSPERTTPTQGAAVQSLTREGPEFESDLEQIRRRFG